MLGFSTLKAAVLRVAGALNGLADTIEAANNRTRAGLALDAPPAVEVVELPSPPSPLDGLQTHDATAADEVSADVPQLPTGRNGRRRTAAATP